MVEAQDPYDAAVKAAHSKSADAAFDAVEVWDGPSRLLTWLRPPHDPV
jgi:hypothetical protein